MFILALALAGSTVDARVFQLWGRGDHVRKLEALGAKRAYESDVTVNGVPGRLSVLSLDGPLSATADRIVSVVGTNGMQVGEGFLTAATSEGASPVRLLAAEVSGRTLVFHVAMDRPPEEPAPWPIKGAPICPGGQVLFGFENHDTRTRLAMARTPDPAASVREFYAAHFGADGWSRLAPPDASLAAYTKGGTLCCVFAADESGPNGATRVVVIEKPMAAP